MKYYLILKRSYPARVHAENLEKGRQAVDQCENTAQAVLHQRKKVDTLLFLAELALRSGDRALALEVLREKVRSQLELNRMLAPFQSVFHSMRDVIGCLELESALLGFLRIWGTATSRWNLYTNWEVGELAQLQIALRRRKSNKGKMAFRKHKQYKKPPSTMKLLKRLAKRHAQNLEKGRQAAEQCEKLMKMVQDQQKKVDLLHQKAQLALRRGDKDLGVQLLREKQAYQETLAMTRETFQEALETLDAIMKVLEIRHIGIVPSRRENSMTGSLVFVRSNDSEKKLLVY